MERCRLVFSGSGGQGLISAAIIPAEAAVVHEGLEAVQSQSCGAAARGGDTRSDVIISDETIMFQPNVLMCLTQDAYHKFRRIIRPGGLLITDSRFVSTTRKVDARQVELPLYRVIMESGSLTTCRDRPRTYPDTTSSFTALAFPASPIDRWPTLYRYF